MARADDLETDGQPAPREPARTVAAGCHDQLNGIVKAATPAGALAPALRLARERPLRGRRVVGHRRRHQEVHLLEQAPRTSR